MGCWKQAPYFRYKVLRLYQSVIPTEQFSLPVVLKLLSSFSVLGILHRRHSSLSPARSPLRILLEHPFPGAVLGLAIGGTEAMFLARAFGGTLFAGARSKHYSTTANASAGRPGHNPLQEFL